MFENLIDLHHNFVLDGKFNIEFLCAAIRDESLTEQTPATLMTAMLKDIEKHEELLEELDFVERLRRFVAEIDEYAYRNKIDSADYSWHHCLIQHSFSPQSFVILVSLGRYLNALRTVQTVALSEQNDELIYHNKFMTPLQYSEYYARQYYQTGLERYYAQSQRQSEILRASGAINLR
jgi:hypothetical protein